FAGSSMDFWGNWTVHSKYGEQFKASHVVEKKPASSGAMEKYLGSGLIRGVGPKTAAKIVKFFKEKTLDVFEKNIHDLLRVPGIAEKKLLDIKNSWQEHKAIRDVMIFLQAYGISTLFAVKIFKSYGADSINVVSKNPYRLAKDIYGIGFFSADKIALNMGFERDGPLRLEAGVKHILSASREEGHCYLIENQIIKNTVSLLEVEDEQKIKSALENLLSTNEIKMRSLQNGSKESVTAYYAKSLFYDEQYVAKRVILWKEMSVPARQDRVIKWVDQYCEKFKVKLSEEQKNSVIRIIDCPFSILTGGPGCGKTTTTKVLVKLLHAMKQKVVLAAPTGRAAQRMSEVIGYEAKTIHRLLGWDPKKNGFKSNEEDPLELNFLIVDECSMLDISLAAALMKAVPKNAQLLFIGDPDQLPSVGAGNVLYDLLETRSVPSFRLTKVFRQAEESMIIRFAHQINKGQIPQIESPFPNPQLLQKKADCLFIDSEEATREQIQFLQRAKAVLRKTSQTGEEQILQTEDVVTGKLRREEDQLKIENLLIQEFKDPSEVQTSIFTIPKKFQHVDLLKLHSASDEIAELKALMKSIHPWSTLHYNLTCQETILRLYKKTIPQYYGVNFEIQILTPQVRGSLGTIHLNNSLQNAINPEQEGKKQIKLGDRIYREGDRVIQTRNNYDLKVYNGDIGIMKSIDLENFSCLIQFGSQEVTYEREDLTEINLAYAITIHKSQGSEFAAVIIPVTTQHFKMMFRNLIYTGLTRAKKLCVFVGSRKALAMAIKQIDSRQRQTGLTYSIENSAHLVK
ncbi:MAG: AAA family ATPase, partial [Bdellovibrionales bacterium]|nr:AAA family ATPase [Bdellovibrionales bacterium]